MIVSPKDNDRIEFERWATKEVAKAINKAIEPAIEAFMIIQDESSVEAISKEPFTEVYRLIYGKVGSYFALDTIDQLLKRKDIEEDLWEQRMAIQAELAAGERITEVWAYTRELYIGQVRNALEIGVTEGLSIEDMAKLIVDNNNTVTQWRAERIARTEVISSSNQAVIMGAEDVGLDANKVWISFIDNKTRDSHVQANDQKVEIGSSFTVGGEGLMYPGDPSGSAENVINCRCAVGIVR